ncbi:MAG: DUF1700 domain-containing protein [Coriobacteriales bacterium]|jgi:uncharacterized membrane protein|nr:DUF1700 domain-containing protein [Coriobacteriales bacterium]
MTAAEYLYELRKRLSNLPPQEIQQAMSYYEEYFTEAGPEGEAELINRLGTPAQVASTIISEYAIKDMSGQAETKSRGSGFKTMWIVIIAVLASPVAIPIAIALIATVFSLLVGLFSFPVEGIAILGVSLIILSLGLALGIGTIKLCQLTVKGITWIFAKILGRKGGQK